MPPRTVAQETTRLWNCLSFSLQIERGRRPCGESGASGRLCVAESGRWAREKKRRDNSTVQETALSYSSQQCYRSVKVVFSADEDEELFEDNPEEYIRRDIEGSGENEDFFC